jgi:uncharacterized membrane protein YeaQ/YmgE (transglycosylase-associated protein family)
MIIFVWITVGVIGGWLIATFIKHSTSNLIDIIFGLIGALVGAFIANAALGIPAGSVYAFLAAACGSFVFIFLGRLRAISK